jgi:hypothetical protein
MNGIEKHLLLDRAVLLFQQFDRLTEEEQDYLSELREALWKRMNSGEVEDLEARWKKLLFSIQERAEELPDSESEEPKGRNQRDYALLRTRIQTAYTSHDGTPRSLAHATIVLRALALELVERLEDVDRECANLRAVLAEEVREPVLAAVSGVTQLVRERDDGLRARPDDLRTLGWAVAVHNDYRQDGVPYTFWLLTKDGRAVKGEGRTDAEALDQIRQTIASFPGHDPATCEVCQAAAGHHGTCLACMLEADRGTEDNPHPVPAHLHSCVSVGGPR